MGMCFCAIKDCACNKEIEGFSTRGECVALEECLWVDGFCPFYKTREQAASDRAVEFQRARDAGYMGHGGLYTGPVFIKASRTPDGRTVTRPDIAGWLQNLATRRIIPQEMVDKYATTHY